MLEILIQKYTDDMNNNPKSKNNRKESSASPLQRAAFGSVMLELNNILRYKSLTNIQNIYEEILTHPDTHETYHNTVQINIKDYLYKETEYLYRYNPFSGTEYEYLICNRYLYKKHQQLTNTDTENNREARVANL